MINVSELINDPDFAQSYTVYRQTGSWIKGKWTPGTETAMLFNGVVTVANVRDIEQLPEADRVKGMMCFHSTADMPIYVTHNSPEEGTSDQILWQGERYRIFQVSPYVDYGYWKALGARMVGN